jgi:hypothetical protein
MLKIIRKGETGGWRVRMMHWQGPTTQGGVCSLAHTGIFVDSLRGVLELRALVCNISGGSV